MSLSSPTERFYKHTQQQQRDVEATKGCGEEEKTEMG
tara:strand:- start:397 stop:507 length:111 start_codon:yes stop_codon:yes gene_type:complete